MTKRVSFFKNFTALAENVSLSMILEAIRTGAYQEPIKKLRSVKNDESMYRELKKKLSLFTPSGTFKDQRSAENLDDYSQVLVLDIDKVGQKADKIRDNATNIEYTLAAFLSPSGEGVKILVNTNSEPKYHESIFNQIVEFYERKLDTKIDTSGRDVSRACFISWDPELYINENAAQFVDSSITDIPEFNFKMLSNEVQPDFQYVVNFTDKICSYYSGNRNNYIHLLACNFNRAGVDRITAESFIKSNFPEMELEVLDIIRSAYKNSNEYGLFQEKYMRNASSASSATSAKVNFGNKTPLIPAEVHENLPELLKKGVIAIELEREKDIFLTAALTILSGCFSNISGVYDKRETFPNLNSFIIAPPGSGKGVVNYSRELGERIHLDKITYYTNNNLSVDELDTPRSLFIPADSSSAAVKSILFENKGTGIICETEADTLSSTFKQDWGGYSDIIRKAFHHEPITYARMAENGKTNFCEINLPKISICLTGTPNQVSALLKSTEDGLFSRFLFYTFKNNGTPFFKNVFSIDGVQNLTEFFKSQSEIVYKSYKRIMKTPSIKFSLTIEQEKRFIPHFDKLIKILCGLYGNETDLLSVVKRLGVIAFRIAMVLTIVRCFDLSEIPEVITCNDTDFDASLKLSEVFLEHAIVVAISLPSSVNVNPNIKTLFEFLPERFSAKEAATIGKLVIEIHEKSVANYLKEMKKLGWLKQPKTNGEYFKMDLQ